MTLLQRYLFYQLIRVFLVILGGVTVLLVFVGVFHDATANGLGLLQIAQILPYVVPSLLPFTIPATLLLTVCVVYGRSAGDREIIAAKAAGINVMSLLWPAFLLGAVLSVCSLILSDQLIPWAMQNIRRVVATAVEDILIDRLQTRNYVRDRKRGIEISTLRVEGRTLIKPTFRYAPPGRTPATIQAERATLEFDLQQQQVILHLEEGQIEIPGQRLAYFRRIDRPFPLPVRVDDPKPRHLPIRVIREQWQLTQRERARLERKRDFELAFALSRGEFERLVERDFRRYTSLIKSRTRRLCKLRTELHSRFSLSCSCLFFVLLGSPFSILQARRQFLTSFFLCFLPILLLYYPLVLGMITLSKAGTVNPAWALWTGNALLVVAAAVVLRRVLKH